MTLRLVTSRECRWSIGSYVGGFGASVLFGWDKDEGFFQPSGLIFSILGAIVALLIWRVIQKRRAPTTTT